jgi:LSD1 subclass zinc finger protein
MDTSFASTNPPPDSQILCQQCAAPLPVEQGAQYVTCQFCGATNFVDKRRAVFHYALRATVREDAAQAALRRWMAGNATVKNLDQKATIEPPSFQLFPMWLVRVRQNGQESVLLEPAGALSISELKRATIPAADLEPYDHTLDAAAVPPTVPYETMLEWLRNDHGVPAGAIHEVSLVHLPIYIFKYNYKGERYTAVVDAATSEVFANLFPAKWEVPYLGLGAAVFAAYFCAALMPAIGYAIDGGTGSGLGILLYCLVASVLAVIFFVMAAIISARV